MKKSSGLLALAVHLGFILSAFSAIAAEVDVRSKIHPVIGYWETIDSNTGCKESYQFNADGQGVFTSDKEVAHIVYEVDKQPNEFGFFKLTHTIKNSNGQQDCTKSTSNINEAQTTYLLFQPDGYSFIACDNEDASLETCFGSIHLKGVTSTQ